MGTSKKKSRAAGAQPASPDQEWGIQVSAKSKTPLRISITRVGFDPASPDADPSILDSRLVTGGGVTLPDLGSAHVGAERRCVIPLEMGAGSRERGMVILGLVRDAVRKCGRGAPHAPVVRELARLIDEHPEIALRMPEVQEYVQWLQRKKRDDVLARLIGGTCRGRPRDSYFAVVALVQSVIDQMGCSVARAASIAHERFGRDLSMDARRMQNIYSEHRDLYLATRGTQSVLGAEFAS